MIKCCIFDLDGTLLNTLATIKYYVNKTLSDNGVEEITEKECRAFVGSGAKMLIRRIFDKKNISDPALFEKVLSEYMAAYDSDPYYLTEKYEGTDELISALKAEKIKLAVLSNKPDFATRAAIERFFGDAFDTVHGARDNIPLKPDPSGCFEILDELSETSDSVAYIGDSDVDFLTGENMAAALNISVLWGFRGRRELSAVGASVFASDANEVKNIILKERRKK